MPKISVIIPVYNTEKYLKQCLDSVINQTLKDIEIICVDDCSTDNSLEILEEYANKDNRIKIIEQEVNQGQGIAKNIGINCAQGDYIMFLDSDDWLELNACEIAYNQISQNNNDFVYFNLKFFYEKTNEYKTDYIRLKPFISKVGMKSFCFENVDKTFMKFGEAVYKIYKKDFLNKYDIRFTSNKFGEDIPFYIKAVINTDNVSVIDTPLYIYRMRAESATTNPNNFKELLSARKSAYNIVVNTKNDNYINAYVIAHISSLMAWYKTWNKLDKENKNIFFNEIKQEFITINENHNVEKIKSSINYIKFLLHKHCSYLVFSFIEKIEKFGQSIFSIKNCYSQEKKIKVITVMGVKVRINRKNYRLKNNKIILI